MSRTAGNMLKVGARGFMAGMVVGSVGAVAGPRAVRALGRGALVRVHGALRSRWPRVVGGALLLRRSVLLSVGGAVVLTGGVLLFRRARSKARPVPPAAAPPRPRIERHLGALLNTVFSRLGLDLRAVSESEPAASAAP